MCLFSGGRIAIGHRYHDLVAGGWGQCPSAERPVTDSKVEGLCATSAVVDRESPGRGAIGRGTQESQRTPSTYRDHLSIGLPIIGLTRGGSWPGEGHAVKGNLRAGSDADSLQGLGGVAIAVTIEAGRCWVAIVARARVVVCPGRWTGWPPFTISP